MDIAQEHTKYEKMVTVTIFHHFSNIKTNKHDYCLFLMERYFIQENKALSEKINATGKGIIRKNTIGL